MKTVSSLIIFFLTLQSSAQTYQPDLVKPKALDLYEEAIVQLKDGELKTGIQILMDALKVDSNFVDAYLSLAGALGELKKYDQAVIVYEKARLKDSAYFSLYQLPYSINLAGQGKFAEALLAINQFLKHPKLSERSIKSANYRKNSYLFALEFVNQNKVSNYLFKPINLGDSVNTPQSEYYPSVTVTDSLLVFTRLSDKRREDFIESTHHNGVFRKWKRIDGELNEEPLKGALSVSQDGEWLLFAADLSNQTHSSFDIYLSYLTPAGWSDPQNLGPNINSEFYESGPTLSPDKRALYFISNRPGGYGGRDIYVSHRTSDGKWGPAENMGPSINSAGDEQAPFIHADNQTLYFTSDGLQGYGGTDLFVIRKKLEGHWSNPENLGYPINTIENEGSLAVAADGLTAYYASDRADSRGGYDIYQFQLRPEIAPNKTFYVKGKILDKKTGKPIPSTVELTDNQGKEALMKLQTDELGIYFVTLPKGKDYTFTVNRKGYLFYAELIRLANNESETVFEKNIYLTPIEVDVVSQFKHVQFASNSFQLPSNGLVELEKLLQFLNENSTIQIEISGHTDTIGNEADNLTLSKNRAKSIMDWLIQQGIQANRMTAKGYGSSKPIANNDSEEGRTQNRRTEFRISKQ